MHNSFCYEARKKKEKKKKGLEMEWYRTKEVGKLYADGIVPCIILGGSRQRSAVRKVKPSAETASRSTIGRSRAAGVIKRNIKRSTNSGFRSLYWLKSPLHDEQILI